MAQAKSNRRKNLLAFELLEARYALHADHVHDTVIEGVDVADESGRAVFTAGDVNGDGIDDFLVATARADHGSVVEDGEVYVVFGDADGLADVFDPSTLNGSTGFRIDGDLANDHFGLSVGSLGDVNGDGRNDIAIGAPDADPSSRVGAGSTYVLFGAASFGSVIDVTTLNGTAGFRIDGATAGDAFGTSVQGAGDINGDGKQDFVVGAPGADFAGSGSGAAYVFYGASSFGGTVNASSLNGANGYRIDGSAAADDLGRSVSVAADINHDGFDDIIVGAPGATVSGALLNGSAFVVFGRSSSAAATLATTSLNGTNGFRINGFNAGDQFGQSVSGVGDFNNDGFGDIVVGSPRAEVNGVSAGASYVVFGKATGFASIVAISSLNGSNGFRIAIDVESDPWLSSWVVNTSDARGFAGILANVHTVVPDTTDVYIHTDGVPSYSIGPWQANPNTVTAQNRNYQIPRDPIVNSGTKSVTGLGAIAVWVDGTAVFNASDGLSYQNQNVWHQNAYYFESVSFDSCNGHPPANGLYHTHIIPSCLMTSLGDTGATHSPILGWSFDGFPIYGPTGYANADGTGGVVRMQSSWQTRNISVRTTLANGTFVTAGPTVAAVALGSYIEDYTYVAGAGHLDQYNGRFSVTPEFPNGIYHYVATVNASGVPAYPYIIGPSYNGVIETKNVTRTVGTPAATQIAVAGLGDVDRDGISDLAIGDPDSYIDNAMVAGSAYVIYGATGTPAANFDLHNLTENEGFHFHGLQQGSLTGTSVGPAGDVNHDGSADVIVGAPLATALGDATAGRSFILNGATSQQLVITANPVMISENGGTTTATVTRPATSLIGNLVIALSSNDTTEAITPASVTILNGQASATFSITAIDDTLLDGAQNVTITAASAGFTSASFGLQVTDYEFLSVTVAAAAISERSGSTTGTVRRNNTDISASLTVNLSVSDSTEATVPATVVIPANATSASFTIIGIDDTLLDGTQTVTIAAANSAYVSGIALLDVQDYESLGVSAASGIISEKNGSTIGTVTRSNTDLQFALTVTLQSSDTTEATVPASVVIPAGANSATFNIAAIDDMIVDGTHTVTITAASPGYVVGTRNIDVTDSAALTITVLTNNISEFGGSAQATLTRDGTVGDLVVNLVSSDTSEATVVASVLILNGQSVSAPFVITAVDDNLLDGTQVVSISATANGVLPGSTSLSVTDWESLSVSFGAASISENGGTTSGTVTRSNTDTGAALTVLLSSSDTSELSVPTSVTIPANSMSVSFAIAGVDDTLLDGTQTVLISASNSGYAGGSKSIDVLDYESLQVVLAANLISEKLGQTFGTITRSNTSDLSLPLTVSLVNNDTSEVTIPAAVTIPANASSVEFAIVAVDDGVFDATQTATIIASAASYVPGTASIQVRDALELTLTIDSNAIQESGGLTKGRLARSYSIGTFNVSLVSSDLTEAAVPQFLTFADGVNELEFSINAVDDTLFDGDQSVFITASIEGDYNKSLLVTVIDTDYATPWHNPRNALDVDDDGGISPLDVLRIINQANIAFTLPPQQSPPAAPFLDTDADNQLTPLDALLVINYINSSRSGGAEGEKLQEASGSTSDKWQDNDGPSVDKAILSIFLDELEHREKKRSHGKRLEKPLWNWE